MYALDNRMERREERISEVKDWTIEMAGSEQEGERDWKKMNRAAGIHGTIMKDLKFMSSESQRRRRKWYWKRI